MKIDRTHNATRNITSGIALKIYQLLAPFVIRTIMIYCLGMEYVGLNTLFTSILQVLNLAELGVGSAMVYSMYKPIAMDDSKMICALMNLYKIYYRIIGLIILVGGIVIMPFLPNLISGEIPEDINIYVLYILNLGATVLSYWLYAYKNCLLTAHQRIDVVYFFIRIINQVLIVYKDAAGMWHEDRYRPLCTALANLIMNLILVQFIGLYGILLSTVLSTLLIGMPWVIHNLFTVQFKMGQVLYVKRLLVYTGAAALSCVISYMLSLTVRGNDYIQVVINLVISCIVPNIIFICLFHKTTVFKDSIRLIDNMIGKRISLAHKLCSKLM